MPISFTGRIRSMETRLFIPHDSPTTKTDGEHILAKCLQTSNNMLKRFVLNVVFQPLHPDPPINDSGYPNRHILKIDLPEDQLEGALSPIADLWLKGMYFNWESQVYHRLISLRLDHTDPYSISEIKLMSILESSPRLRFIDIELIITRSVDSPDLLPMHLPDLELLVGDSSLLRLIRPGSNELTVTIADSNPEVLYEDLVKGFFSCANLVYFCNRNFLHNISDVCHLLSIAPRLRGLGLSHITLNGILPDPTPRTLDTLYLLNQCVLERHLLDQMISGWAINRVFFRRASYHIRDEERIPYYTLEGELSNLSTKGIKLEFAPEAGSWSPPMDVFLGPPRRD
ncbi:hypothetical protein FRC11_010464 [Ceratobasidium sp. 423]|nr:hypothetical protein FRC11_010464 [Ceratobasidium sp. 423]